MVKVMRVVRGAAAGAVAFAMAFSGGRVALAADDSAASAGSPAGVPVPAHVGDGVAEIVELSGKDFTCDFRKSDRNADLTVELVTSDKGKFSATVPAGRQGVRISRDKGGGRSESY